MADPAVGDGHLVGVEEGPIDELFDEGPLVGAELGGGLGFEVGGHVEVPLGVFGAVLHEVDVFGVAVG